MALFAIIIMVVMKGIFDEFANRRCLQQQVELLEKMLEVGDEVRSTGKTKEYHLETNWCVKTIVIAKTEEDEGYQMDCNFLSVINIRFVGALSDVISFLKNPAKGAIKKGFGWGGRLMYCVNCLDPLGIQKFVEGYGICEGCEYCGFWAESCRKCFGSDLDGVPVLKNTKFEGFSCSDEGCDIKGGQIYDIEIKKEEGGEEDYVLINNKGGRPKTTVKR